MQDSHLYYHQRKIQFVSALEDWSPSESLSPEDLIYLHLGYASDYLGFTVTGNSDPQILRFQEATRSLNQGWALSWIVYLVNDGVVRTMSDFAGLYAFDPILPTKPYINALLRWAAPKYTTSFPCSGDVMILKRDDFDFDCGFVSEVNLKSKRLVTLEADTKARGQKLRGVNEITRNMSKVKGELTFIDMRLVYQDFLSEAQKTARLHDVEVISQ